MTEGLQTPPEATLLENTADWPEDHPLCVEWKTFKREASRLIGDGHRGRFVIIKGDQLVSIWDTLRDAVQAGAERLGHVPFLVQEIQPCIKPFRFGYARLCQH